MSRRRAGTLLASAMSALVVVAIGVGAAAPARADDAVGSGFQSFSLTAVAGGQRIIADTIAGQGPGTIDSGIPEAEATMTTSTGHALSSVAWPSALVGNAGSLLFLLGGSPCTPGELLPVVGAVQPQCSPVPIPQPVMDQYHYLNTPIRAEAQNPTKPNADASLPGLTMTARAGNAEVAADAIIGASLVSDIEKFASLRATSITKLTGAATAVSDAHSTVSDIEFAGGEVTIGSVASTAHSETKGDTATSSGSTTVHDMKVHGIPVSVDATGVHVAGQPVDAVSPVVAAVNQVLTNFGMKMFLTRPTQSAKGGVATFDAGSLIIDWSPPGAPGSDCTAPSCPPGVTFEFGGAHVTAASSLPLQFDLTGLGGADLGSIIDSGSAPLVLPFPSDVVGGVATGRVTGSAIPGTLPAQLASNPARLPKGISGWWVVIGLLAAGALAGLLRRLPDRVLDSPAMSCPDGGGRR